MYIFGGLNLLGGVALVVFPIWYGAPTALHPTALKLYFGAGGLFFIVLGGFVVYCGHTSYVLLTHDWIEIKDAWKLRRYRYIDVLDITSPGPNLRMQVAKEEYVQIPNVFENREALATILIERWKSAMKRRKFTP